MTVLTPRLMEVTLTMENLQAADRQVKANGGAPGDGIGAKALAHHSDRHGYRITAIRRSPCPRYFHSAGWWRYFPLAGAPKALIPLDGWVRRHMGKCFLAALE